MLNEAVKEAVGLGLMSAYEAQTLMAWIERPTTVSEQVVEVDVSKSSNVVEKKC